ncbi:MAG: hypothetical protein ACK5BJ_13760 [Bacteroidota bacterium]|jgi:hypothetical protein
MRIACLGWGSLIWKPESLKIQRQWFNDGPILPIEFTRQSKDGRLTLVITDGAKPVRVLWALMDTNNLDEARKSLQIREGVIEKHIDKYIGLIKLGDITDDKNQLEIMNWAKAQRLDAVIWTKLGSKFGEKEIAPTIDEAVNYLKSCNVQVMKHAEEYIRRTPRQIDTQYRQRFEKEWWSQVSNATN